MNLYETSRKYLQSNKTLSFQNISNINIVMIHIHSEIVSSSSSSSSSSSHYCFYYYYLYSFFIETVQKAASVNTAVLAGNNLCI